jgi:predicted esterase YcpF (UPF0227 family)
MACNRPDQLLQVPDLLFEPTGVIKQIKEIIKTNENLKPVFVGSSLGGYYANYLAEKYNSKAVMINPAIRPYRLLSGYLGDQTNPYTLKSYCLTPSHMVQLQELEIATMSRPENRMVLLQTGDEVLDYREAADYYRSANCYVEQGGDHSFQNFARWLPQIVDFLEIKSDI